MAVSLAGLSTLGVTFGYGVEESAGQKPTEFKQLDRIVSIGGISQDVENLDASCLEDVATKYIAGRADSSGTWECEINLTPETTQQWKDLISAYNTGMQSNKQTWFEVIVPSMTSAFFVIAQPPQTLPLPEFGANEVLTVTITLTIVEYKGEDTKVDFTA